MNRSFAWISASLSAVFATVVCADPGYFRQPALSADSIVFVAEGDLWRTGPDGGAAQRLTTHASEETNPAISPDGRWLAFSARYEGPQEIYVMPLAGGAPRRLTFDGGANARVQGWTAEGKVLYSSTRFSGKPGTRLYTVDPSTSTRSAIPLAQAAEGCYLSGRLVFSRRALISDNIKRYKGGGAQSLWRFDGNSEAVPLTADYPGTSRQPMCWDNRVYFLSDRDGAMNIWSMNGNGGDLRQHTGHKDWDIRGASLGNGRIVYQLGADLRVLDIKTARDQVVNISLTSDFEQTRTRWVKTPLDYVTSIALSPTGDRIGLVARGQVFVTPVGAGRRVEVTRASGLRARNLEFTPDGKSLLTFTDASGEFELWRYPANGVGAPVQLTREANLLRRDIEMSPDGKWVAHTNKERRLYLLNVATGEDRAIAITDNDPVDQLAWSPDSRWLAFRAESSNDFERLGLLEVAGGKQVFLTSTRYHARSPAFSVDGKFLYFLSDRNLQTVVGAPWGQRNPEPFFDRQTRIYGLALTADATWPFLPRDELQKPEPEKKPDAPTAAAPTGKTVTNSAAPTPAPAPVKPQALLWEGLNDRLYEVPVPAGNYSLLSTDGKRLYYVSTDAAVERKPALKTLAIEAANSLPPVAETFFEDLREYKLSGDRKKVLLRRANDLWVVDAGAKAPAPADLGKFAVNLRDWTLSLDPREEWNQIFTDAWRMHRDFFWEAGMHGADWKAVRAKYQPLLARVTDRAELDDVLAQVSSEAAALHSQVGRADLRKGADEIDVATLAADLAAGPDGYRVVKLFGGDPELLEERSPLARPEVHVKVGDVITRVNGIAVGTPLSIEAALRNQSGKQVLLSVHSDSGKSRDVIVTPVTALRDMQLRYLDWERTRNARAEQASNGRIGYVHLQAMGPNDIARWAREFYPVFQREGLIIDVRSNNGGSIDSWIIEKLQRRVWMFWKGRESERIAVNPQLAFRGHIVALVDADTYSDGETIAEGLKRLGIATLVGKRTAGAGIWLSDENVLRDKGIARAAELGVFVSEARENRWIVEGVGVEPDMDIDNPPYATFKGEDAQLETAIRLLMDKMAREPVPEPKLPPYPARAKP
ncbi:MAG: PD40 domain-containing protein [Betaproteobacteria bacterium]|nr:PD40 domain-containing protein [Betaproteobacteria bacterium]